MTLRRSAFSGAAWTSAAALAVILLQLAQIAVLARLLRPEDFGLMALVVLVVGFGQAIADVGLSGAIIQRQDSTSETLSSLFWLNLVAGAGLCAALTLAAPLVAAAFGEPQLRALVALAALSFLVTPVSLHFQALLQKSLAFRLLAGIDVLAAGSAMSVALVSAFAGQAVYSLLWGFLSAAAVRGALLVAVGFRRWRPELRFRREDLRGYGRFGAFQVVERSINYLGFNLDKLLIGSLIGTHGLGLYSVAYQLAMRPVQLVAPIVNRVALPVFAMAQADDARLRAGFLDALRIVSMLMFPVYMGMIALAEPFVRVVLGDAWLTAVPVLRLLAVLGFFYSIGNPIGSLLVAKGRVGLSLMLNVWLVALYALATVAGAHWGVEGIATGLVLATACGLFPVGFLIRWQLVRMRPAEYLASLAPALGAALIMGACLVALRASANFPLQPLAALAGYVCVGALVYLLAIVPWQWKFLLRVRNTVR